MNGDFETDFEKKAGIFNIFFANQCSTISNSSDVPEHSYNTNKRLTDITFSLCDLSKIIKKLNPNKAHGHDNISIKMTLFVHQ